ncbi:MAG: GntR family transcriptional regulator, transcriptional repressor for pyruvate dehydrogenase complex [Acidimicrobiaceae bacterium]|nr:GntR family transcriptional regulator, transcriptional repressor for pyruvate dehydrogenase complex [Acidimicrobiaceae bacterium]
MPRGEAELERARTRRSADGLGHRRTEKISEVLAREIVHDMRSLPPSTMLPPEAVMLDKYRVGRASLREALRILEVQGLIVIRPGPGGGPMVAAVDSRHFARMASLYFHLSAATYRDIVEARLVMEPVMARLAAERQVPESLSALEQYISAPGGPADDSSYLKNATGFHSLLSGLSSNPVLDLMGRSLKDIYTDRLEGLIFPPEARSRVEQDHAAIAKAILRGASTRAERLMRDHMVDFVKRAQERNPGVLDEIVDWH